MVPTDAAKYDGCKALGFVLIGPAVFICMFNSWFCCIVVNCQFNLVSYLALKISLSFGGTVGIPLDATCCGDSETHWFLPWSGGWMVDEKSLNYYFVGVLTPWLIANLSFFICLLLSTGQTKAAASVKFKMLCFVLIDWQDGLWFMVKLLAWQTILFWQISISGLIMCQGWKLFMGKLTCTEKCIWPRDRDSCARNSMCSKKKLTS